MKHQWLSAHLFYMGSLDVLLADCVAPFIHQHLSLLDNTVPYFYIRYPEGGDHIRLRLNTRQPLLVQQLLNEAAASFFQRVPSGKIRQHSTYYPDHSVQYLPYQPEVNRYGNAHSLPWAERHFFTSSRTILHQVCTGKTTSQSVPLQAVKQHLLLLLSTGEQLSVLLNWCMYFINDWLQLFKVTKEGQMDTAQWMAVFQQAFEPRQAVVLQAAATFWNQALQGVVEPAVLQWYYSENVAVWALYRQEAFSMHQLTVIVTSMMHMTHNRMGIENQEEAYILYCTYACLCYINAQALPV